MGVVGNGAGMVQCQAEGKECFPVKKIVLVLMMAAVLMLGGLVGAGAEISGDYGYWLLNDGTVEIRGYYGSATELEIPAEIDGYRVTQIADEAFKDEGSLTSVVIPEGVTYIGDEAFNGCDDLTSVVIPDSITHIGTNPFMRCFQLKEIIVSDHHPTLRLMDGVLFEKASMRLVCYPVGLPAEHYTIPLGTRSVDGCAFWGTSLKSIEIAETVKSIGNFTFCDADSLTCIEIPNGLKEIGENPFRDCDSLTEIKVSRSHPTLQVTDGVLFSREDRKLICYPVTLASEHYSVPKGTKLIGGGAFLGNKNLTSVVIPEGVTSIGWLAFSECYNMTEIDLPDSVTSIGNSAFYDCIRLKSIVIPRGMTRIGNWVLGNCFHLESIVIPDSVTSIGYAAFGNCWSLKEIQIPDSVTYIDQYAFYDCDDLTSIVIPDGVTRIYGDTFSNCAALTSVVLPDGLTEIGLRAFGWCKSLTSITIPESVTEIGSSAFYGCTSLTSANIPAGITDIDSSAFSYCPNLTLTVVAGTEGERYAQNQGIPYQYAGATESAQKQDAPQGTVTDGAQEDGLSNLRMMLLSADTSYGGVLYYYVYNDQVYVDAARLARLRNAKYDEANRTFVNASGVVLGNAEAQHILPTDAGYVRLDRAAHVLCMTFSYAQGGRVSIHAAATQAELKALCDSIQENTEYRLYEQAFNNDYYNAAQYGYVGLDILLSGDPVGGVFGLVTGNRDQEIYDKAFETIFVDSVQYEQTMELAAKGESAIIEPLKILRFLEKACNEEDGALAELLKSMGVPDGEISVVLGEWSKAFYELVYASGASSAVLTMAEVYEALDDLYLADLAKEIFAVINLASAVAEMDELTVAGLELAFTDSENDIIVKGANKILKIHASSVFGGAEAVIRALGDTVFEDFFAEVVDLMLEYATGNKALSIKQQAIEATLDVLKGTVLKEGVEGMDAFLLNTAMCHLQQDAYTTLEITKDISPETLRQRQAVAAVYLRTVIAICENGQMGSDQLKYEAQAQLNRLMSFDPAEYGKTINNQAFINTLLVR